MIIPAAPDTSNDPPVTDSSSSTHLRLDDQLCFALYAATNEIIRTYRPLLAELGLTYPQYLLLMALWERDNQTVTEVAHTLRLPAHGLLPIITRLERTGFLNRNRDPHDRRAVRLTLTTTGRALEHRAAQAQHQVGCRTKLSPTRLGRLRGQLHQLTTALTD